MEGHFATQVAGRQGGKAQACAIQIGLQHTIQPRGQVLCERLAAQARVPHRVCIQCRADHVLLVTQRRADAAMFEYIVHGVAEIRTCNA